MSGDGEVAALKKELQQVKQRAVSKIKALQSPVDELSAKLAAASPSRVDPPESSEDGSEASSGSGFVKVGTSVESLRLRERECEEREALVAKREEAVAERERAVAQAAQAATAAAAANLPLQSSAEWHGVLLKGLHDVQANLQQVELATQAALGLP